MTMAGTPARTTTAKKSNPLNALNPDAESIVLARTLISDALMARMYRDRAPSTPPETAAAVLRVVRAVEAETRCTWNLTLGVLSGPVGRADQTSFDSAFLRAWQSEGPTLTRKAIVPETRRTTRQCDKT